MNDKKQEFFLAASEILLQVFPRQTRCRTVGSGIIIRDLLQQLFRAGVITVLVINTTELEHRIGNLAVIAEIVQQDLEILLRGCIVTIQQIQLAKPVMRVAGIGSVGVLRDETVERSDCFGKLAIANTLISSLAAPCFAGRRRRARCTGDRNR